MIHATTVVGGPAIPRAAAQPNPVQAAPDAFRAEMSQPAKAVSDVAGPSAVDRVFARYDMTAISPREVDQMAQDLQQAGFEDTKFLLMFLTRGEEFNRHLRTTLAEAGFDQPPYDPTARIDLIGQTRDQIRMARAHGDPTEYAEHFLRRLEEIQATRADRVAAAPPGGDMAQALVMARSIAMPGSGV